MRPPQSSSRSWPPKLFASGLSRLRIGGFGWLAATAALAYGARGAYTNTVFAPAHIHCAAVALGALVTSCWLNDTHRLPAKPRHGRHQQTAAAPAPPAKAATTRPDVVAGPAASGR